MYDAESDSVKIADLGLALVNVQMNTVMGVSDGSVGGTPSYLTPDVALRGGDEERGAARDMYAFGAMVVEMIRMEAPASRTRGETRSTPLRRQSGRTRRHHDSNSQP